MGKSYAAAFRPSPAKTAAGTWRHAVVTGDSAAPKRGHVPKESSQSTHRWRFLGLCKANKDAAKESFYKQCLLFGTKLTM